MTIAELSEKIGTVSQKYAEAFAIHQDDDWYVFKLQEELGELTQSYLMLTDRARKKGQSPTDLRRQFEDEIADTFSLLLLLASHFGVDIQAAVERKWFQFLPAESDDGDKKED